MNLFHYIWFVAFVAAPECTENQKFFGSQVAFVVSELQHLAPPKGGFKEALTALWRWPIKNSESNNEEN